jgi:hypothetical protein
VLVVHHAEDVPERIGHRGGNESRPALDRLLVHRGAHGDQPLDAGADVVHVPVDHRAPGLVRPTAGREPAVDDAELVLVVPDAELDVNGRLLDRAHEVRLDSEELGVPVPGGRDVVGEEADGGESSEHCPVLPWSGPITTILRLKVITD